MQKMEEITLVICIHTKVSRTGVPSDWRCSLLKLSNCVSDCNHSKRNTTLMLSKMHRLFVFAVQPAFSNIIGTNIFIHLIPRRLDRLAHHHHRSKLKEVNRHVFLCFQKPAVFHYVGIKYIYCTTLPGCRFVISVPVRRLSIWSVTEKAGLQRRLVSSEKRIRNKVSARWQYGDDK